MVTEYGRDSWALPTRVSLSIEYDSEKRDDDREGVMVELMPGQTICVDQESKTVFVLSGDISGIAEELDEQSEKDNDPEKKDRPLKEISPVGMMDILKDEIEDKNKRVYVSWNYDNNSDEVKVWVDDDLPKDHKKIMEIVPRYIVDTISEEVWTIDPNFKDKPIKHLIGKGLGAIINLENGDKV